MIVNGILIGTVAIVFLGTQLSPWLKQQPWAPEWLKRNRKVD